VLALCRDISERKRIEQERRQLEAQLIQAQKMEAIGTLAGGIAHDFNNLLGGVFGYIDMARESAESGDMAGARQCLALAMGAFERTKALTNQLLTFSKGGAPVKRTVDLAPLLRETATFALAGANVEADFRIAADLWHCDVDAFQISQVIDNLIINARQAMPGGGSIVIEGQNLPPGAPLPAALKPGLYVRISVRDQGTGIAPEHLPRIFEPFFTTKQKGSGLGLATSYSIVARHGGHILAQSELGKGTTMTVFLPASASARVQSRPAASTTHQGHGRVLLMDDEPHIRDVTSRMLTSMGYQVTAAADGKQAEELFSTAWRQGQGFDLVMLDLTVPGGLGGKELVARLRALAPQTKIIATSGYSEDPVMADPRAFGFSGKIAKPYTRAELALVLQSVMG
jgi:nitrogen-specific signal transduction histidine kinase/CheY-like chemotaxis protein